MKLYFVRHGESEASILDVFSNRGRQHGLTPLGVEQVRALAQELAGAAITHLYASPLLRATQSADILSEALGLPYEITDALREFDCGVLEGAPLSQGAQPYMQVITDWAFRARFDSRIEGGESLLDIKARFAPFVERLVATHGGSESGIVLVGHGGTYRAMLPLVLDNVTFRFAYEQRPTNAGYALADLRAGRLTCLSWWGQPVPPPLL